MFKRSLAPLFARALWLCQALRTLRLRARRARSRRVSTLGYVGTYPRGGGKTPCGAQLFVARTRVRRAAMSAFDSGSLPPPGEERSEFIEEKGVLLRHGSSLALMALVSTALNVRRGQTRVHNSLSAPSVRAQVDPEDDWKKWTEGRPELKLYYGALIDPSRGRRGRRRLHPARGPRPLHIRPGVRSEPHYYRLRDDAQGVPRQGPRKRRRELRRAGGRGDRIELLRARARRELHVLDGPRLHPGAPPNA